jgi:4-hydroxybenzoate polyprenyltransferase
MRAGVQVAAVNLPRRFALDTPWGGRMSKLDSAKEELGWLKVVFAVLVAIDASLIAWVSQTYTTASGVLVGVAIIAVALLTAFGVWINRAAYRKIRELENL